MSTAAETPPHTTPPTTLVAGSATYTSEANATTTRARTSTSEPRTTASASCNHDCEEGWAAGPGSHCFKFIDAASSKAAANWTYLDFDRTCTEIGQSLAYMSDFDNDNAYQLFANLSSQSRSHNTLVFVQALPSKQYSLSKTVTYVDISANHFLKRHTGTVLNNDLLPNISSICRTPKYCAEKTCHVDDYFTDDDAPSMRHLLKPNITNSLLSGEAVTIECTADLNKKTYIRLTCNRRGYLQPHPSFVQCQALNETSLDDDAELPNIRVKNCTQCFNLGTERCVQGDDGSAKCICRKGWRSSVCAFSQNFCRANPCQNGGTCDNDVDTYQCSCVPGFKGSNCQIDATFRMESVTNSDASAVYKQVTTKDTLLAVWTTICAMYVKYRATERRQGNTPQETLQQSRQIITGVALALNAWFRNPSWWLFGGNGDELSCRVFYWTINSLLLTCMCLMYHEAENMYGVLQGRWHNVWEHGNIDFATRFFGSIAVGFGATAVITFYYWDELPQPASCIGGFHDSSRNATLLYFAIGTVVGLLTCWRIVQSFFAWRSEYYESVRYDKATTEKLGPLWVVFPRNYAIVTQPVEINVFALWPVMVLYWLSWALTVYANDSFSMKLAIISSAVAATYTLANTIQTYITDPNDFRSVIQFFMVRGPCMWTPAVDYYSMKMWAEVVEEKKTELLQHTIDEMDKAKEEYRQKEHEWIDRVNDAIRTTYAAVHGVPKKRVPKELLLNKPGEGPKQIDRSMALRAEFAWLNPSNATYVPVLLRKLWFDWWTKDYLLQRRGLPRRENLPWEAAKNVHRRHWCEVHTFGPRDTAMNQLFYLWAIKTVKSDTHKPTDANFRDVMKLGLKALTMPEVEARMETTEHYGPAPVPLVTEQRMQEALQEDRERDAVENVEWDQVYEDDPEPSLRKRVQFKRSAVTGKKINTNPRKRSQTEAELLELESKPHFIGAHRREDQLPPGVRRSALKRLELQVKQDREWEELKDADRLMQQTQLWRSKTFSWWRQLFGIRMVFDDEVRHNLPNELNANVETVDEASMKADEQLYKEQEFADKLQEELSKMKPKV